MPQSPKKRKREPKGFQIRPGGTEGEEVTPDVPAKPRRSFEDLGELPHGYGSDTIFLVAQDPHRLFTYWDIDISRHPGGAAFLRVISGEGAIETQIEVPFEVRNWYIPVSRSGSEYFVEIGFFRGKDWNLVARSAPVTTPPEELSPSDAFDFATVPFHLSFQRMVERVEAAARSGEDLLAVVSRMQRGGDFSAFGPSVAAVLPSDPRALLAGLLGPGFLDELASGGWSSSEIEASIRERVGELLSSGGASETSGSFAAAAFASQFGGSSLSSESLASWAVSELVGPLASWSGESSWSTSLGVSAVTSWLSGGSWLQALSGSWEAGSISSWSSPAGAVSSWLQAGQSSWAAAALSSWPSAQASSWFAAAAESSWSGASESLHSFGGERGFFMHVNAEVIFYGGTDPNARVTIGGVPVELDAQGNFRYHFVFPNADYEIPIVAESPDGLETRSATLRFQRATGKVGIVTETPQPPLGEPMGRHTP